MGMLWLRAGYNNKQTYILLLFYISIPSVSEIQNHNSKALDTLAIKSKLTLLARASCSLATGLDMGTGVEPGGRLKSESLGPTPNPIGGTGSTVST